MRNPLLALIVCANLWLFQECSGQPAPDADKAPTALPDPVAAPSSSSAGPSPGGAILEGCVTYQSDPKRPWKLSRYYITNSKEGWLAEAVVALDGPSLPRSDPAQLVQNHSMDQVNFQFVPETIAIRVGDSIRISNSDDALHNVMTSDSDKPFNINLPKGEVFTRTFNQAGGLASPIRLGCVFHGAMRAWIYVFDHPWFVISQRGGQFQFDNVPPGTYTLGLVHPAGKLRWSHSVELKPNEKASIRIQLSPDDLIGSKQAQIRSEEIQRSLSSVGLVELVPPIGEGTIP